MKALAEILKEMDDEDERKLLNVFKNNIRLGIIPKKDISKEYNKLKEALE